MLKTYSYTEHEDLAEGIHDKQLFEQEKQIVQDFVTTHPMEPQNGNCPACEAFPCVPFAVVSGIPYMRCEHCFSIFLPIEEALMSEYKAYAPLREYRQSGYYQDLTLAKREKQWKEMCFWIHFRCVRYLTGWEKLVVAHIGNRYEGLAKIIERSDFCGQYRSADSPEALRQAWDKPSDIALLFDAMQYEIKPVQFLRGVSESIKKGGLLFLGTRVGSGFDILTLKGGNRNIFPYEHAFLPSVEGITIILEKAGFRVLELAAPGTLDVRYVMENKNKLDPEHLFMRYLLEKSDPGTLAEFQRFLQKSGMSSFSRVIAVKE